MKPRGLSGWLIASLTLLLLLMPGLGCQKEAPPAPASTTSDVSGQVYEYGGYRWIPGARVELGDRFTTTSDRGEFTLASMPLGQYQLRIQKDGFSDYTREVTVERVTPRINVYLTKRPNEYRDVTVSVRETVDQRPIPDASVIIGERSGMTDDQGVGTVRSVPYGRQTLRIEKIGYQAAEQPIDIGQNTAEPVVVTMAREELTRDVTIAVWCPVGPDAYPVPGADVTLGNHVNQTDASGNCSFRSIPFGSYPLSVTMVGFHPIESGIEVGETTPPVFRVEITELPNLIVFRNEQAQLSFALNGNNQDKITEYINQTPDEFSRLVTDGARKSLSGYAKVIKLTNLDREWRVVGQTIRVSNLAQGASFLIRIGQMVFFNQGENERPRVVLEVDLKDGSDVTYLVQLKDTPLAAMAQTMTDEQRRIFLNSHFELRYVTDTREDLREKISDAIDVASWACLFGTFLVPEGAAGIVLACRAVGLAQIADGAWDFVETLDSFDNVGVYMRKPGYDGDPRIPLVCVSKVPDPAPPPFYNLWIAPEQVTTKLGGPSIQFDATAIDANQQLHNVNDIANWSLEGLTGTLTNGYFTPWQTGTGYVVVSLRPQWNLDARASVTVRPANRPPSCTFTTVGRTPTDDLTYWVSGRATDPDQDRFDDIAVDFADGEIAHLTNGDLNPLGEFTITHRFPNFGDYNLHLTVADVDGAECNSTYPLHISPPPNEPPVSHPSCPARVTVGQPFQVSNNATDADGTVIEYRFRTNYQEIITPQKTITLTFYTPGFEQVCMAAKDDDGEWSEEICCEIEVVQTNQPPTACFTVDPPSGTTATNYIFDAVCSSDDHTPTASLLKRWDYDGNGTWDTGWQSNNLGSRYYSQTGTYYPKLIVKDEGNLTHEVTGGPVTVSTNDDAPIACFMITPGSGDLNTTFTFDASCSSDNHDHVNNLLKRWKANNGGWTGWHTSNEALYGFQTIGIHTVYLEVKDSDGYTNQTSRTVEVTENNHPPTITRITPENLTKTAGEVFIIEWTGSDSDPGDTIQKYQTRHSANQNWQDHHTTSAQLRYDNAGSYWFEARAVDNHGLEGAAVRWNITINQPNQPPTACFTVDPTSGDPSTVFTADPMCSSDVEDPDNELEASWKVNSGAWSSWETLQNHQFGPFTAGDHTVWLKVRDSGQVESQPTSRQINVQQPTTGTIIVTCNISQGSWTIQPGNLTGSGTYREYPNMQPGTYTNYWNAVPNYDSPSDEQQVLVAGGSIRFNGFYSYHPPEVNITSPCPGPWTIGVALTGCMTAEGGEGAICWHADGLPDGITLDSQGCWHGAPNIMGQFRVYFRAWDCQVPANEDFFDCVITVQDIAPAIELWPTTLDLDADQNSGQFHVARTQGGMPIHCYINSDNTRVTTYPPSEMYTDGYVTVNLNRQGQSAGNYSATVTVSPDGGLPKTCDIYWTVGENCDYDHPEPIEPWNGQSVSLSHLTFRWQCHTDPCTHIWVQVFDAPDPNRVVWYERDDCSKTAYWYNPEYWDDLQPGRTYWWRVALEYGIIVWSSDFIRFTTTN